MCATAAMNRQRSSPVKYLQPLLSKNCSDAYINGTVTPAGDGGARPGQPDAPPPL